MVFVCFRLNPDFLLLLSATITPLLILVISFSRYVVMLGIFSAILGIFLGLIDCLANLQLVNVYDKAVAPFLQVRVLTTEKEHSLQVTLAVSCATSILLTF